MILFCDLRVSKLSQNKLETVGAIKLLLTQRDRGCRNVILNFDDRFQDKQVWVNIHHSKVIL